MKPYKISIQLITPQGQLQKSAGVDEDFELAFDKAVSEFAERYWGSDLAPNTSTAGLVEHKVKKRKWCSTGAAAHVDLEKSKLKSMAELVERDTTVSWMASGVIAKVIRQDSPDFILVQVPCRFIGWNVAASIRIDRSEPQRLKTLISAGASQDLQDALRLAEIESHLRSAKLSDDFLDSRLPLIRFSPETPVPEPIDRLEDTPGLQYRDWKWRDRWITKFWSDNLSDFYRGLQDHTYERYSVYTGITEWQTKSVQRRWFF